MATQEFAEIVKVVQDRPIPGHKCRDFDNDCLSVPHEGPFRSFVNCWLYDPDKGYCPFLHNSRVG